MTRCYVFDLDGTLADLSHRLHFIESTPPDWRAFFAACGDDKLHQPVYELYRTLQVSDYRSYSGCRMVIMSGRSDECQEATQAWLDRMELPYDALYMRKAKDRRPDYVVKRELLNQMLADNWEPILFVDDRDQVVNMWRSLGYTCLQVAPGNL